MKPYISCLYEYKGKIFPLPLPPKYRELLSCVHTLGLKDTDDDDDDDMRVVGYKAIVVPKPDDDAPKHEVEKTAKAISRLDEKQVLAIGAFCAAFGLGFSDITDILAFINTKLEVRLHEHKN